MNAPFEIGQRVYAGGKFGEVERVAGRNHHQWCVMVNGSWLAPSEVSADVLEFPTLDTAPCEVQP